MSPWLWLLVVLTALSGSALTWWALDVKFCPGLEVWLRRRQRLRAERRAHPRRARPSPRAPAAQAAADLKVCERIWRLPVREADRG
ncbi:hypothetical protein [Kitasatospora cinereorecta]|uniref:Uncharacterized protein n=1 Tax=Kitasatospora cinereorecta TaxID=285560 RepID=A0ABW0VGV1_9ACTN